MRALRFAALLGLAHGLMDAATGFAVATVAGADALFVGVAVIGYNLAAFGLQPLFGMAADRARRYRTWMRTSLAIGAAGALVAFFQPFVGLAIIAVGSALFHVCGGALATAMSPERSTAPALFTAPGVVGLAVGFVSGAALPALGVVLSALLVVLASFMPEPITPATPKRLSAVRLVPLALFLVLAAVTLRSAAWSAIGSSHFDMTPILLFGAAAAMGKLVGGFVADRAGAGLTVVAGAALAMLCLTNVDSLAAITLGVFFLQTSTPVALAEVVARMPNKPATASGLVLGLTIVAGGLIAFAMYQGSRMPSPQEMAWYSIPCLVLFTLGFLLLRHRAKVR